VSAGVCRVCVCAAVGDEVAWQRISVQLSDVIHGCITSLGVLAHWVVIGAPDLGHIVGICPEVGHCCGMVRGLTREIERRKNTKSKTR